MTIKSLSWKELTSKLHNIFRPVSHDSCSVLRDYIRSIDEYNASQPNYELLNAIRTYNHCMVDSLNSIKPLSGLRVLDVGASPHGYALERSLSLGVCEYVGIGLDIKDNINIITKTSTGRLTYMNAEQLAFDDNEFDAIITMSTFEHIGDVGKALSEFRRVLKPNGCVLINFEPIWTCSYGHHLHHLGDIAKLVPDWGHLLMSKDEMMKYLNDCWPQDATLSVPEACVWIYEDNVLNRKGIIEMRKILSECKMHIEWIVPIVDEERSNVQLTAAMERTKLLREDLMTKGLSALLYKY